MSKELAKKRRPARRANDLADLGLFNIPDFDVNEEDDDSEVDDSTLESELEALLSGNAPVKPSRPKARAKPVTDIEKLAAECMKDEDDSEEDDSNLELDEDLVKELHSIAGHTPPPEKSVEPLKFVLDQRNASPPEAITEDVSKSIISILEERLSLYNGAISVAKSCNDNSKARRYGRAVKTLESQLKTAKAGGAVNEEDIPPIPPKINVPKPEVSSNSDSPLQPKDDVPKSRNVEKRTISERNILPNSSLSALDPTSYEGLVFRRNEYRKDALNAKKIGNKDIALNYMKTAKTFDAVIEALKNGEPVDLANLPPPPVEYDTSSFQQEHLKIDEEKQASSVPTSLEAAALSAANEPEDPEMFDAPPPPASILEALQQRLEKYTSTKQAAENEGNSGKVRRLQRIIKLYETAIKDHKANKAVDFESLPTPPGFAPIPINSESTSTPTKNNEPKSVPVESTSESKNPKVKPTDTSQKTVSPRKPKIQRTNTTSIMDKQLEFLLERQKMFRQAALSAKKNGDIQQAKEYLRMSKGFDSMIEATRCGLPIDSSNIPTPPQLESDFVLVDVSECVESPEGTGSDLLETLEKDLLKQIEICSKNKEHFLKYGDVISASKFEKSGLESRKDLSVIQHLKQTHGSVPRFHYEKRLFSIVYFNDLPDNQLKVTVERGFNLPGKPELDSFVRIEFPIPAEASQKAKTQVVTGNNNPCFQEDFIFEFNRKSRSQLRQFKRQAIKFQVFSRGGFLRSDGLLGTVNVKLVDLESKCTIHDSFNLMDGRKPCGAGKLEVKLEIREPLLGKQVEEVCEKWLVIGS